MFRYLQKMSIAKKLPLLIVGSGGIVAVCVGVAAYMSAAGSLEREAKVRLTALISAQKTSLDHYLESIHQDLRITASNATTREALKAFSKGWRDIEGNTEETLQRLYIEDNPHPTGQKENLDAADDNSFYSKTHKRYHPWFRDLQRERGYYDVFLFDRDGNLVYSVFKELDYATNLVSGQWASTDLGNAFRASRDNPTQDYTAFFDFRAYGPSHGAPASFISKPILNENGALLGVLAFQMPVDRLKDVLQQYAGLGASGDVFLVGSDQLMRSDSRFAEETTILTKRIDMDAVERALNGESGYSDEVDTENQQVIAAFAPMEFEGVRWALIGHMAKDEIMAQADELAWQFLGITAIALAFLSLLGWWSAGSIVKSLQGIMTAVGSMIKGEVVQVPGTDRGDEIGLLARSMDTVYQKGLEAVRLRSALDGCNTMLMVANRNHQIVYANDTMKAFFGQHETEIKRDLAEFNAERLIGSSIHMFHKKPEQTERTLEGLHEKLSVNIKLGGRRLRLVISAIRGGDGKFLGTVVEWLDATSEVDVQEQIDQVIAAAREGDFERQVNLEGVDGVYRKLAVDVNELTTMVGTATHELGVMLGAIAKGDLTKRIKTDFKGRLGDLKDNANTTADQLAEIVTQIKTVTVEVENASAEIGAGTDDLAKRTEHAATNIEETAASTEEMASAVRQNAEYAQNADQLVGTANNNARQGGDVVEQAVSAMGRIEESSQKITAIIGVIDEIAFQTNLLALNASVEAARAGEAGKGFAVVAQEVRQLAQRSAQAASDIKNLIQDSNSQVQDGVALVNNAGRSLEEILSSIGEVVAIVQGISTASQEQASGIQEINNAITSMDEVTQQNSALVEESTASARTLGDQARRLTELVAFFNINEGQNPRQSNPKLAQPRPSAAIVRPKAQASAQASKVVVGDEDGWSEF